MQKILNLPYSNTLKNYLALTKPGIIFGNLITASSGFALATNGKIHFQLFFWMLLGLSIVIASACTFNNYIDRHLDAQMSRTQNRPLVKKTIPNINALCFASILLVMGLAILSYYAHPLAMGCALLGFIFYVFVYSFSKYQTSLGTLLGSIAGATPPLVGYAAVTHKLDYASLLIFLTVVLWQMPHFYAIAIYRLKDYALGSIPVLPIHKGMQHTKVHVTLYVLAYTFVTYLLCHFQYTTHVFGITIIILGLLWFLLSLKGFKAICDTIWARQMFIFSLIVVMIQSSLIVICRK